MIPVTNAHAGYSAGSSTTSVGGDSHPGQVHKWLVPPAAEPTIEELNRKLIAEHSRLLEAARQNAKRLIGRPSL
jgi:hypothetical protein